MNSNRDNITETIKSLKHPDDYNSMPRIPVFHDGEKIAFLRAVPSKLVGEAKNDALLMAKWRNQNKEAFFSCITSTEESTIAWLEDKYNKNYDDIIFMIETIENVPVGHIALWNFDSNRNVCEFGRVIRGSNKVPKGCMTISTNLILQWANQNFGIKNYYLEVFENNKPAVSLYTRCGFRSIERIPLCKHNKLGFTKWEKQNSSVNQNNKIEGYALKMIKD